MVPINNGAGKVLQTWTADTLQLRRNLSNDLKVPGTARWQSLAGSLDADSHVFDITILQS